MRILGIDFGLKRVGLALCDADETLASPYATLERTTRRKLFAEIEAIAAREGIEAVVVGLPLALDGSQTESTRQARNFAESLARRLSLPVHLVDERLSSAAAEAALKETGLCSRKRKKALDSQAAALILQGFLDAKARGF
jgi:putative Holliday junction resolvase